MTLTLDTPTTRSLRRRVQAPANALLLGALWFVYAAVRNVTSDTQQTAIGNASKLLRVESALGIDIEGAFQSAVSWPHAFVAANTYYLLHFPITLTVLAVTFWRRRMTVFTVLRNSLIGSTAIALVIHLIVPMAPPRMLPGFVDAGATFGPDPYSIAGSESANQFAAMPSMHVAWAILVGFAIWQLSTRRAVRAVGVLHPVVTSLVVIVTGHHFVSDVAIGAGLAVLLLYGSVRWSRPTVIPVDDRHRGDTGRSNERRSVEQRSPVCRTPGHGPVPHTEINNTPIHGNEIPHAPRPPTAPADDPSPAPPRSHRGSPCASPDRRIAAPTPTLHAASCR